MKRWHLVDADLRVRSDVQRLALSLEILDGTVAGWWRIGESMHEHASVQTSVQDRLWAQI